ncbi:MAG: hypothetical protein AB7K24_15205 [Gemmataceae bacterium]
MDEDSYVYDDPVSSSRSPGLLSRPLFWFLFAVLIASAAGSWYLAGTETWLLVTLGSVCIFALVIVGALRGVAENAAQGQATNWRHVGRVFGYLVLVWVVWIGIGYFFPWTEVRIYPAEDGPDGPSRAVYRGRTRHEFDATRGAVFSFRGRLNTAALRIETFGPAGWMERPFRSLPGVTLEDVPTTTLYIDNRARAVPARLEWGELTIDVPANRSARRVIMLPPQPPSLLIDGRDLGPLLQPFYLIDITGTRQYELEELTYDNGMALAMNLVPGAPARKPPRREVYQGNQLHCLPGKVDFFLEGPPDSIRVTGMKGLETPREESRFQLQEIR